MIPDGLNPRSWALGIVVAVGLMGFCQQSCLLTYALWSGSDSSTRTTRTVLAHGDGAASGVWADEDRTLGVVFAPTDAPDHPRQISVGWDAFPAGELRQALGSEMVDSVERIDIADTAADHTDECTFSITVRLRPLEGLAIVEPWVDDGGDWLTLGSDHQQPDGFAALESAFAPYSAPLRLMLKEREITPDRAAATWRIRDALGHPWSGFDPAASTAAPVPGSVAVRIAPIAGRPPFDPFVVTVPCDLAATARLFSLNGGGGFFAGTCHLSWRGQLDHHLGTSEAEVAEVRSLITFAKPAEFHWTLTENKTTTNVGAAFANGARIIFTPVTVAIDIVLLPVYFIVLLAVFH